MSRRSFLRPRLRPGDRAGTQNGDRPDPTDAPRPGAPIRYERQRFIAAHLGASKPAILEIGAFDTPTWPKSEAPGTVRYLDWFSAEELRELHHGKPRNWDHMVEVDYVVKEKRFAARISERFDLIVANHVLEHIADPIAWLREVGELAAPGGHLCLAVPDRRYTFDYIRPLSTAVDLLRANDADLTMPDYWQALASTYLYRPIRAADCWPGPPPPEKIRARRFDLRQAMEEAARARDEYVDVHCSVFTQHSFGPLVAELRAAKLIPWRMVHLRGVQEGGNEFVALLKRA